MPVYRYKNGTWYVKYYVRGEGYKTKCFGKGEEGSPAHNEATVFDDQMRELSKQGLLTRANCNTPAPFYLADIAQDYYDELKTYGKFREYHRYFVNVLNAVILPALGDTPPDLVTHAEVRQVVQALRDRGNSAATVNRYRTYLDQIYRHGLKKELITKNPVRFWDKLPESKRDIRFSVEDARKVYNASPDHVRWAMVVGMQLVARIGPSELFAVRWSDVHWERHEIRYYMPKVSAYKTVPCSDEFMQMLRQRHSVAQTEYLIEYRGKPIKSFKTAWATSVVKAGLGYSPRPYDLRHITISGLLMDGKVPVAAAARLAGHRNTTTTLDTYCHADTTHVRQAVQRLPRLIV